MELEEEGQSPRDPQLVVPPPWLSSSLTSTQRHCTRTTNNLQISTTIHPFGYLLLHYDSLPVRREGQ
jgi:hypothetical protein